MEPVSIFAIIAGVIGILGSILPGLPGPPLSWVGLLILYIWGPETMSSGTLVFWGVITLLITILDFWIPSYFTKKTGGSVHAERGSLIGMFIGIFLTPVGMITGAFLGALIGEMVWAENDFKSSLKVAIGSFIGFMLGTGIKVLTSAFMMWKIIDFA